MDKERTKPEWQSTLGPPKKLRAEPSHWPGARRRLYPRLIRLAIGAAIGVAAGYCLSPWMAW